LLRWIHRRGKADFAVMSDLAQAFRAKLAARAVFEPPPLVDSHLAADGSR
jgi:23S rRNA (adenine2503-C2)-methyltransferase